MRLIIPPITAHIPYMVRRRSRNTGVPPLFMKWLGAVITSPFIGRIRFYELFGPIEKNRPNQKTANIFPPDRTCKDCFHSKEQDAQGKKMPPNGLTYPSSFEVNVCRFMSRLFHGLHLLLAPFVGSLAHDHIINTLSYFSIKTNRSLMIETGVEKP